MKFRKIKAFALSLMMLFVVVLSACGDENDTNGRNNSSNSDYSSGDESYLDGGDALDRQSTSAVSLDFKSNNSWKDGDKTIYEYKGIITNNKDKAVTGWTIKLPVSDGVAVKQCWGATYEISGGYIIIKPETYNKSIPAGGNINFGMQIQSSTEISADKAVITADIDGDGTVSVNANTGGGTSKNNGGSSTNTNSGGSAVTYSPAKDVPAPSTDDWLSTKGNKIVDSSGKEVWLTGVNWFGYNTGLNCFDGVSNADLNSSIASIADHGFNLLRVPISAELINQWQSGVYPEANYNRATNAYLTQMNSLQIFDYIVGQCRANGIKIMIDIHCAKTDSMGHMKPLWTDGNIDEAAYLRSLAFFADRYKNDDTVIAFDLKNEPHGKPNESPRAKWDNSTDADNWKYIAEKAANTVLSKNPNVLIMVEGIEIYPKNISSNGNFKSQNSADYDFDWWGGNLRGVKDNPVNLGQYQNKLVYSPHDYGPAVYKQPWFNGNYTFESLYKDCWKDNWMFIYENNTAPLLVGEWGGFMTQPNLQWMTYLRKLIKDNHLNHTFWCYSANSGDTGGLVQQDCKTWDMEKYNFVKEVLWQKDGKFVSLDHKIPLGKNGITLSAY